MANGDRENERWRNSVSNRTERNNYISMMPVFAALVDNNSSCKISDEHCDYKWVNPEEAKKLLAWVGQRNSVDIITHYFTKEINFLNFIEIQL